MRLDYINTKVEGFQDAMYRELNLEGRINHHRSSGRSFFVVIPIVLTALGDVLLETLKVPVATIEYLALAILNAIGSMFSPRYTISDALYNMDQCLINGVSIPVALFMFTFKFLFQLYRCAESPESVQSISYLQYQSRAIREQLNNYE